MLSLKNLIFALVLVASIVATCFISASEKNQQRLSSLRRKSKKNLNQKEFYPACDSITRMGYPCENIPTSTEDGFVLGAIRIPPKVNGSYPVILQHGLIDCSSTWSMNYYAHQNLATILHNAGYDVIIGNSRGNHYSRTNEQHPNEQSAEYFRLTDMDGMASGDVPALIKKALQLSNHSTCTWIGHSQGTLQAFAAFSTVHPELAKYVDLFVALAPVTTVSHTTSLLLKILADLDVANIVSIFGNWFMGDSEIFYDVAKLACPFDPSLCVDVLMPLVGNFNVSNINVSAMEANLMFTPGGTSVNNMLHWQQLVKSGKFQKHDYGQTINEQIYNQSTAPYYNLSNYVAPPTVLVAGTNDALADPQDVEELISKISPGGALVDTLIIDGWAHMDFVWNQNAYKTLYPQILQWLKKYAKI